MKLDWWKLDSKTPTQNRCREDLCRSTYRSSPQARAGLQAHSGLVRGSQSRLWGNHQGGKKTMWHSGASNLRCSSSQLWLNLELPGELLKPCCPGLSPGQLNKNLKPQRIELLRHKYFFKIPPVDSNLQPGIENYDSRAWLWLLLPG